jgi:hypothetical protein
VRNAALTALHKRSFLRHIMTTDIMALTPVDRLSIRVALASLDMLKLAASDLGVDVADLNEQHLTQWVTGSPAVQGGHTLPVLI